MTNGDKIRAMTDEEELLSAIGTSCYRCIYSNGQCDSGYGEGCIAGNLEWLRKEAEEEPELIDREQAGKNICKYCASNAYCKEDDCMVHQGLRDTPTIQVEAEPVRHGRWNYRHEDDWCYCTACGTDAEGSDGECLETDYCPHCGARMDGGE